MSPAETLRRAEEALAAHRDNDGCDGGACTHAARLQEQRDRAWRGYVDSLTTGGVR